jgi:hypothetical protein
VAKVCRDGQLEEAAVEEAGGERHYFQILDGASGGSTVCRKARVAYHSEAPRATRNRASPGPPSSEGWARIGQFVTFSAFLAPFGENDLSRNSFRFRVVFLPQLTVTGR